MRALVVEDDVNIQIFLSTVLQGLGYEVYEAGNGLEALAALQYSGAFDLMVSDLLMPMLDGVNFVQWVRQEHPLLPILVASAYLERAVAAEELPKDVTTIQKPFSHPQFVEAVKRTIRDAGAKE
mgnify:CR=1 FL=1